MPTRGERIRKSREEKNDEFYTIYADVADELPHYRKFLKGKRILCPCDWDESFEERLVYSDGSEVFPEDLFSDKNFVKDIDIDETGNSPIENAIIKAKAYNKISNIVTIATQVVQPFGKFKSELNEEERKLATNAEQRKIIDFILNTINTIENFQKI